VNGALFGGLPTGYRPPPKLRMPDTRIGDIGLVRFERS
jgi:hypothetical protein